MDFDFVNILTIISVVVTIGILIHTMCEFSKEKREKKDSISKIEVEMSDYDKILRSTYGLEKAREKNTGKHFDDETIYLNRAKAIRENSSLFSWINEC